LTRNPNLGKPDCSRLGCRCPHRSHTLKAPFMPGGSLPAGMASIGGGPVDFVVRIEKLPTGVSELSFAVDQTYDDGPGGRRATVPCGRNRLAGRLVTPNAVRYMTPGLHT
jgi:hypothetical protein